MKAEGLTPGQILQHAQRLMVPLFQRPYVWGQVAQWEPLWDDITRMADALLENFNNPPKPHFLGAVVLQQRNVSIQSLPQRIIIDGQQRLTTLQIIIDAVQAMLEAEGLTGPAARLRDLIENEERYRHDDDDVFKLWPTNKDREAYREVMGAKPPIDYGRLSKKNDRIVQAHKYFSEAARDYLLIDGQDGVVRRADALEVALKQLLKIVVIDLDPDEDAQEIFETLNSRGVKLSAADLIKNFIFQRLEDEKAASEQAYEKYWSRFETSFWEVEITSGRLKHPRTALFLNHFLVSRTGELITASDVFQKFKVFTESAQFTTLELLKVIHDVAEVYEKHLTTSQSPVNDLGPVELFLYRTQAMDVEIIKSVLIYLLDPSLPTIPENVLVKSLTHLESWLVRRSLMRVTTKGFNRLVAHMVSELLKGDRQACDEIIKDFLTSQTSESSYWPDDVQLAEHLNDFRMYRLIPRPRTRMILEALEDDARGFTRTSKGTAEQRCARNVLTVEHVLPQKWDTYWPLTDEESADTRNRAVHYIGNLTLLTTKLNTKVSNGPWNGDTGKRKALMNESALLLNAQIETRFGDSWSIEAIRSRNEALVKRILEIWPVPTGHRVSLPSPVPVAPVYVSVADLIAAGMLEIGAKLVPTWSGHEGRYAVVKVGGALELDDGRTFESLSAAGRAVLDKPSAPGWHFWRVEESGRILFEIRDEYRSRFSLVTEDEYDDDEPEGASAE